MDDSAYELSFFRVDRRIKNSPGLPSKNDPTNQINQFQAYIRMSDERGHLVLRATWRLATGAACIVLLQRHVAKEYDARTRIAADGATAKQRSKRTQACCVAKLHTFVVKFVHGTTHTGQGLLVQKHVIEHVCKNQHSEYSAQDAHV